MQKKYKTNLLRTFLILSTSVPIWYPTASLGTPCDDLEAVVKSNFCGHSLTYRDSGARWSVNCNDSPNNRNLKVGWCEKDISGVTMCTFDGQAFPNDYELLMVNTPWVDAYDSCSVSNPRYITVSATWSVTRGGSLNESGTSRKVAAQPTARSDNTAGREGIKPNVEATRGVPGPLPAKKAVRK